MRLLILVTLLFSQNAFAAGDAQKGKQWASQFNCTQCHGEKGIALQRMHPNLAGQKFMYLKWQLSAFKSDERPSHVMNGVAKQLSDQQIEDLATYYSELGCTGEL